MVGGDHTLGVADPGTGGPREWQTFR